MNVLRLLNFADLRRSHGRKLLPPHLLVLHSMLCTAVRQCASGVRFSEYVCGCTPKNAILPLDFSVSPPNLALLEAIERDLRDDVLLVDIVDEEDLDSDEMPWKELLLFVTYNGVESELCPPPTYCNDAIMNSLLDLAGFPERDREQGMGDFLVEFIPDLCGTLCSSHVQVKLRTENELRHIECEFSPLNVNIDREFCLQGENCYFARLSPLRRAASRALGRIEGGDHCRHQDCPNRDMHQPEFEAEFLDILSELLSGLRMGKVDTCFHDEANCIRTSLEELQGAGINGETVAQLRLTISCGQQHLHNPRRIMLVKQWARLDIGCVSAQEGGFKISTQVNSSYRAAYPVLLRTNQFDDNGQTRETATLLITETEVNPEFVRI